MFIQTEPLFTKKEIFGLVNSKYCNAPNGVPRPSVKGEVDAIRVEVGFVTNKARTCSSDLPFLGKKSILQYF